MFKKPISLGTSNKLSKGDRKKITRVLQDKYAASQEALELIMPVKDGEVEAVKVAPPSRAIVYIVNSVPAVIDTSGKGDYFPTIFALWRAPKMLPQVFLKHSDVSHFIIKGADLMLPGVAIPPEGLQPFKAGDLVSICVHGNPAPMAVGVATMSSEAAVEKRQVQGRGRMVELLQHYGDCLWSEIGQQAIPNEGFQQGVVVAIGGGGDQQADDESEQSPVATTAESGVECGTESTSEAVRNATEGVQVLGLNGSSSAGVAVGTESQPEAAKVDMEALLEQCLLQSLHKDVKDKELPMNSNVLWKAMVAGRPSGVTLDLKASKHKKLSKFLQVYSKAGLITTREDKHSGDAILTGIRRDHKLYQEYVPYKVARASGDGDGGTDAAGSSTSSSGTSSSQVQVEEVLKPTKEVKPIFEAVGARTDAFYSIKDAYDVVLAYVQHARLEENARDSSTIVLDPHLCDALFKGIVNVKKGEMYPTHLPKAQLRDAWIQRFQTQCMVTRGGKQIVKKGQPAVNVSVQKRQGSKKVTCLDGMESFLVDPEEIAQVCQKLFAASATVNDLPGKQQGHEVVVQGSVADKLAAHLVDAYGIPKKYINVKK